MARQAKLKPQFDHTLQKWALNIPASLSETGQRQEVYLPSGGKQEALDHADQLKKAHNNLKELAKHVSPELMRAARGSTRWYGYLHWIANRFPSVAAWLKGREEIAQSATWIARGDILLHFLEGDLPKAEDLTEIMKDPTIEREQGEPFNVQPAVEEALGHFQIEVLLQEEAKIRNDLARPNLTSKRMLEFLKKGRDISDLLWALRSAWASRSHLNAG